MTMNWKISAVVALSLLSSGIVNCQTLATFGHPIKDYKVPLFLDWGSYKYDVLDTSRLRLFYNVDVCLDSLDNDRYEMEYVKLIGTGFTKFQPRQKLRYDVSRVQGGLGTEVIDQHHLFFYDAVIEDLGAHKLTVTSRVCQDDFLYEEAVPVISWTFTGEEKLIGGYACSLAECDFRGRHYYAWYTEDVPVASGPWLLNGLPGLVVYAYDTSHQYEFTFSRYDGMEVPIILWEYPYKKVSRQQLNKVRSEILRHPIVYMYHHLSEEDGWYISYKRYDENRNVEYRYDTIELE